MIHLVARDAESAFGVQTILDTEKVPYATAAGGDDDPLIAGRAATSADLSALAGRRGLVLHGGADVARRLLGASSATDVERTVVLPLSETLWHPATVARARALGVTALTLPTTPLCSVTDVTQGNVLARLADGTPAIVERDGILWCAIDLGAAFTRLLTERAVPAHTEESASSGWRLAARRIAEHVYYAAPEALRQKVQRRFYASLEQRLATLGDAASTYPVDPSGWLLAGLLLSLVRRLGRPLVRIARWPAPFGAAATLTHDIEPRRFAYTRGLTALLGEVAMLGHPATFGLVARSSMRWLDAETVSRLGKHGVLCHGLAHRGENVCGRDDVRRDVETARRELERRLGRSVAGYRSPRLDRSPDLAWALDHAGFAFDSSYPDVDRENIAHFGGGVRVNVPYRPPLATDDGKLRPSRCLELPLTAPDCIQPLLGGASEDELRATVAAKAAYVRETGGLYVALVHGGVFGESDRARRAAHLEFVAGTLRHPDVWLAGTADVADWWRRREALRLSEGPEGPRVVNGGTETIAGVRVVVERDGTERVLDVPPLAPGASFALAGHAASPLPPRAVAAAPARSVPAA
jgi:peptidoglycan/xylan/chitin deacetylase (PgdA/CDA1 family)